MKIDNKFKLRLLGALALPAAIALSSCTAEPDESNRFTFTGETVNDFLLHNDSLFSDFNYILRRSGQDRLLSSYGTYTCFAPKNAAIQEYVDSLYDDPESLDENGNKLHNGMTGPGLEGLTDSLCLDIVYYHLLKTELTTTEMLTSEGASYRTMLGRSITAGQGTGRQILVNNGAPIDLGMCDQELVNGYLHAIDKCIPRSNRVVANELKANIDKFSIFYEALEATGLDEAMNTMEKTLSYTPPAEKTGYYIPTECKKGFTLFAEPDWVFNQHGIHTFPQLVEYCKEVYGKCATGSRDWDHGWYDYFRNNGIEVDMSDNYTKENNVVHMFVAYHMLKAAVNPTVLAFRMNTYSGNGWTNESYDYYETMLPKTLIKAWRVGESSTGWTTYINRYVTNNTLTDGKMTKGSASMHEVVYEGVGLQLDSILQPINGYIYPITDILVYDAKVPLGVLNERMRFDALSFMGETMDNGYRGMMDSELSALSGIGGTSRLRFPIDYFDNIVVFNGNSTQLDMNTVGDGWAYSLYKGDSFQGMGIFDFCIKLPPVPDGTYELRINQDCMPHGTMVQFSKGNRPEIAAFTPLGVPMDMRVQQNNWEDPAIIAMGCVPLTDAVNYPEAHYQTGDAGIESDKVMHTHGYLRAPLSICREPEQGGYVVRFHSDQYRKVLTTDRFLQEDVWLRLKTALDDGNTERKFQIDYIEFVPVGVASNARYLEDMY